MIVIEKTAVINFSNLNLYTKAASRWSNETGDFWG